MKILKENEVLDDLQLNELHIIQNINDYRFTCDSVLLSDFVKIGHKDNVVEFCSGSGVISILINEKYKPRKITGFEIQPYLCEMSNRSLKYNSITNIEFVNLDLSKACSEVGCEKTDVLVCNPPYYNINAIKGEINQKYKVTKYETLTNLEKIFKSAEKILKFGGKFFLVHISNRIQEIMSLAQKFDFSCKELQLVYPNNKKLSHLALFYFTKKGKSGCNVLKPIILNS